MSWYYAVAGERKGPVVEQEFQRLIQEGAITPQTLVWHEGMTGWQPFSAITATQPAASGQVICANCGGTFAPGDVIQLANQSYCAGCKPLVVQRLREGVTASSAAEEIRNEHIKHEASIKSIGILYYLGGAGMAVAGLLQFFMPTKGGEQILMGGVFILLAVAQIVTATGLRGLKKWARLPTAVLSGIGLLGFPIGTLINVYILYLVFSQKGKMVFSDEYQDVVAQTPHIKYRTSILVLVLVGLLVAALVAVVIGALVGLSRR